MSPNHFDSQYFSNIEHHLYHSLCLDYSAKTSAKENQLVELEKSLPDAGANGQGEGGKEFCIE